MPGRPTLLLAFLFLLLPLQAPAAAPAQQQGAPAIVLQLPPGMTADQIRDLVGNLESKGATRGAPVAAAPAALDKPLIRRLADRLRVAAPKLGEVARLPAQWRAALAAEGHAPDGFWLRILGLLAVALVVEYALRAALPTLIPALRIRDGQPLHRAFLRHLAILAAGFAGFVLAVRFGASLLGQQSPLLIATVTDIADNAVRWRGAVAFLTLLLAPGRPTARPLHLDDPGARQVSRWINAYLVYVLFNVAGIALAARIGADPDLVLDLALGLGALITIYKTVMFLRLRRAISAAILVVGGEHPSRVRRLAAAGWHWLFILLTWSIFVLALEQFAEGANTPAVGAAAALQAVVVGMALAWAAKQRFLWELTHDRTTHWWRPVANRTVDMVVLLGGFAWLAALWGYDLFDPAATGVTATVLRPIFRAFATLAVAWLIWSAIGGFLRERAPHHAGGPSDDDGTVPASMSRLATLLPLIRNCLAIAIFFLGGVVALGDLGVDVGPLLAGAGVVGIALGFGAQALVRDIIAGLFFLIDDAFRLGEYIDTGRLKGTVEAISIRSLRLRHQNGQVHTIPFGQIQAVTNSSRDWAIVKFNLHIAPDSDLELVRKTVKQLGLALLEDPEIGGDFIQPLKMQGVADVTQGAIMIRCKFTARPLRPSFLRRQAMREIIQRFGAAGIAFAPPPATASNPL